MLCRVLIALRWMVRLVCNILILACVCMFISIGMGNKLPTLSVVFITIFAGIIPFTIKSVYDLLIFKIKPDDYDVWLSV